MECQYKPVGDGGVHLISFYVAVFSGPFSFVPFRFVLFRFDMSYLRFSSLSYFQSGRESDPSSPRASLVALSVRFAPL